MADSIAFDALCGYLEAHTAFDRLEARGTVRLTLKQAGLDARDVNVGQLRVVVERLLGDELEARGIEDVDRICGGAVAELHSLAPEGDNASSPEAVFRRFAGD